MEDFARAVEDGLKLSKRLVLPGGLPPPRPPAGMERGPDAAAALLLPAAPMAYAVVSDPGAVDTPDVPSYQPYVYGRLDPPALIPLQMKEIDLAVDCALDTASVTLRARWWLHCITRSRECDVRLIVPMGEQGSILGAEVTVGRMSYNTQVTEVEDQTMENTMKGILKPHMFCLTIPQVEGGADIVATVRWSQKLHYDNGRFTVDIPFCFPYYVNPLPKVFMKREKIQLTVNSGFSKEVLLQGTSHSLKEKARQGDKLSFLHEAVVENWSSKDFTFSYSVYSGDLSGGIHVQPSTSQDYDDRDTFSIFILPGSGNRKAMALLSSAHDALPQIFLMTDGSVDDEHDICQTVKNELLSRGSKSPRISTFGLGLYCNHYFLRMVASIGKGHFDAALETGSIESRIVKWFRKASNTIVANISIDATKHLDDFEVDSEYIPDISAQCPLCISGKYQGKFPETVVATGYLADMTEISIELKVQHITDMPLDNIFAAQQIALLTAKAWLSADKQLERKVIKLSIENSVLSEYTSMVVLQTNLDAAQKQVKQKPKGRKGANEPLRFQLHGLKLGFGDKAATRENLLTCFGDEKPLETLKIFKKAGGCCSRVADCLCCMCCIKACNKMNDQCAILMAQVCAALSCLGCYECCAEVCCGGSES
ncbi:uncharacterized protein LOC119362996 isoform X3 [Triticum dicoccoides]|uniref:uncharacterized protein LOC119362996 isoform X3 n=1 Tax=Triticum dicoccoides TaxID=85692 RepID=UPI00188F6407|nr:uncharacterized protein LOC119362996 isoform X3 [Triticum dicoccoides]